MKQIKILGIDPGSNRIGYGLISKDRDSLSCLDYGLIEIKEPRAAKRLLVLADELESLIKKTKPDLLGVEKLYFWKNQKTAMAVSEARGVILASAGRNKIPVREYSPTAVKQRATGYGTADKKAVLKMVRILLGLKDFKSLDDASDALAIAIAASLDLDNKLSIDKD